jgi:hypothetical protein
MKQTAVEWLYKKLHKENYIYENMAKFLKEAKEMEKQQIIEAYNKISMDTAEQYYNETFNK